MADAGDVLQGVRRFMDQLVASVPVEYWLESVWPSWWPGRVRHQRDEECEVSRGPALNLNCPEC